MIKKAVVIALALVTQNLYAKHLDDGTYLSESSSYQNVQSDDAVLVKLDKLIEQEYQNQLLLKKIVDSLNK